MCVAASNLLCPPPLLCSALIDAFNVQNPQQQWGADREYLQFSTKDFAGADGEWPGWPMPMRETFAALLPDLARQVPGLLDGLDADDVMMLRTQAEMAAPAHVKSLEGFQKHALAAGEKAFSGQSVVQFINEVHCDSGREK